MIDDATLEELFSSAAEAIEVPADGPVRALAARDALRSRSSWQHRVRGLLPRNWHRRPRLVLLAGACALVAIAFLAIQFSSGIGSSANVASAPLNIPSNSSTVQRGAMSGTAQAPGGVNSSTGMPSLPPSPPTTTSPNMVTGLPPKVVKTGSTSLQVDAGQLSATMSDLGSDAAGLGGFVASSSQTSDSLSSGEVTLRVPVANFETLVADLKRLGKVTTLTTNGQDVTSQYVDLQARITSLQDARTQFEQILAKAQSINDILSVESQIEDLQTQIEQLQGQLKVLNDQATYSTLTVQVSEVPKGATATPPSGFSKAWEHALHSFTNGLEAIISASGGVAVFIISVTALAISVRLLWKYLRRRLI